MLLGWVVELRGAGEPLTIEDVAREVFATNRLLKFIGALASLLLVAVLASGWYLVQTVIENNVRLNQVEANLKAHESLPNHPAQSNQLNDISIRLALMDQRLSRMEAQGVTKAR